VLLFVCLNGCSIFFGWVQLFFFDFDFMHHEREAQAAARPNTN
jgi:hypothetical protein